MSKDGRNEQAGADNWQYDGGWYALGKANKKLARERDKYTCRRCKCPVAGRTAHVHHVVAERCFATPQEAHDLQNLVTVCDSCHLKLEWETIYEMYQRVLLLDEAMEGMPGFVSFSDFKAGLVA
jgi:hypothetical protein